MIKILILTLSGLLILIIFLRRWYLLEKGEMLGKMVFKKGKNLTEDFTKDDVEVTAEDITNTNEVSAKMEIKANVLFKRGETSLGEGDMENAEKLYIQALSFNPNHSGALAALGGIYLRNNLAGKAEIIFRKLVVIDVGNDQFLSSLALSLFKQEKFEEAKTYYSKALEIEPKKAGRRFALAQCMYETGEFEKAFKEIDESIATDGKNLDFIYTKAYWLKEKSGIESALEFLNQVKAKSTKSDEIDEYISKLTLEA